MRFKIGDKVIVKEENGKHTPEVKIGDIHIITAVFSSRKEYATAKGNIFKEDEIEKVMDESAFLEGKVDAYREIIKLLLEERRKRK